MIQQLAIHAGDKVAPSRRQFLLSSAATALGLGIAGNWDGGLARAQTLNTVVDPRFTAPVIDPLAIPQFVAPTPAARGQWLGDHCLSFAQPQARRDRSRDRRRL